MTTKGMRHATPHHTISPRVHGPRAHVRKQTNATYPRCIALFEPTASPPEARGCGNSLHSEILCAFFSFGAIAFSEAVGVVWVSRSNRHTSMCFPERLRIPRIHTNPRTNHNATMVLLQPCARLCTVQRKLPSMRAIKPNMLQGAAGEANPF